MIRKRLKKRRKGANRLDLSDLKKALRDRRQWSCMGVCTVPDGESSHFELVAEDGQLVDILVDVVTQPLGAELTCRLGGMAGAGTLTIPAEGDEVAIIVPDGRIDFMPVIVAILSSNDLPNEGGQGPAPGRTLVVNGEVLIHDGSGGAEPLPTLAEFKAHTHNGGTGPTTPTLDPIPGVGPILGTTVLKAK